MVTMAQDQRTLITGGAGLVGSHIADQLVRAGAGEIIVLDNFVRGRRDNLAWALANGPVRIIESDIRDRYGLAEAFPTPERHHLYGNRTMYGAAKSFNEGLLRSFHEMYGLDYVALRYFNVYGPRMDIHGVYTEVLIRWMERII